MSRSLATSSPTRASRCPKRRPSPPPPPPRPPPPPPPPHPHPPPPPPPPFTPPKCAVPKLVHRRLAVAKLALRRAHCRTGRVSWRHSRLRRGLVLAQTPRA